MQNRRLTVLAQCMLAAFGSGMAIPVLAQQPAQNNAKDADKVERIEITGSRIKRIDSETAAPVQVITRDQIEKSGATSLGDLLKRVPASNAGGFDENAVASFTPGAGGISLRGLGPQATLVLINGRRITPFGFASGGQSTFVDVNSISLSAIERVEILLDSASAIYGSEAMGGVINVILRKDFTGGEVSGEYGTSSRDDAKRHSYSFTGGIGDPGADRYNLMVNAEHRENDALRATDRPNTSTANYTRFGMPDYRSSYSNPGNLYGPGFLSAMPGCKTVETTTGSPLNGRCIYDHTQYTDLSPRQTRDSLFLNGVWDLTSNVQVFGDLMANRSNGRLNSASYSTATYDYILGATSITLPSNHPQNPYGEDVQLRYRFNDVPTSTSWSTQSERLTLGARATDLAGWDVEGAVVHSRMEATVQYRGMIRDAILANEVLDPDTGAANPNFYFGDPSRNDPALMNRLYPTLSDYGKTSMTSLDFHGSRELMALAGGPLAISLGGEVRRESFVSTPDPLVAAGEIGVLGSSSSDGARTATAFYAELSAPVVKGVELQIAGRNDHYPNFGDAFTPKFAIKWKALSSLAFRGTYSEGFRAPSLTELVQSPTVGFYSGIIDPKLCADPTDQTNPNCDLSVRAVSGSNSTLKPEKSKSLTLGLVFEPTSDISATIDYYRIKRRNEIAGMDPEYLLANESKYPSYVQRNASTGEIDQLLLPYENLGSTEITGFDIDLKGRASLGEYGKVGAQIVYSYTPHYRVRAVEGAEEEDWAGTYSQPKERWQIKTTWEHSGWSTSLNFNYTGGFLRAYTPSNLTCPYPDTPSLCSVSSWLTTDLIVSYKGFKDWTIVGSIDNIEDKMAPIDERRATRFTMYNATYHNPYGRYFRLAAKYAFR